MSSVGARRFLEEMAMLIDKLVIVETTSGQKYEGRFVGFYPETLSVCLANMKDAEGRNFPKTFINGNVIAQVFATEKPFDLAKLAERLERVFPRLVKVMDEAGVIIVMDKIRVTKDGVIEGSGPAAERVKKVYDEFVKS